MVDTTTQNAFAKAQLAQSRFLFVIGQYSNMGGAERQAIILADQIKNQMGYEAEFLAWGGEGRVTQELNNLGIKAWVFPLQWSRGSLKRAWRLWQLARFIKREIKPDYLLPYIGFNCKIIGLIWRRTGARYTWWNQRDEGREVYGSWMEKRVINSVPDIVSNSDEGKNFLVTKFDLSPECVFILNNGISIPAKKDRATMRGQLRIAETALVITMVANLTHFKDHQTLIQSFAELCADNANEDITLMLVGRQAEVTECLKAQAFDLGLSAKVRFVGEVTSMDEYYAATDVLVHSSRYEGCPNAVLEAMAHGLPVCGTDISGIRQAVGENYPRELLAPVGDVDALKSCMQRLVDDIALREVLGQQNLQRIKKEFSPEKLAQSVLSLIRSHQEK